MELLPDDIRRFILSNISSVFQLEVLLLLREERDRDWLPEDVSRSLYTTTPITAAQLEDLATKGLLRNSASSPGSFRFGPRDSELEEVIERLARLYQERRVAVVSLIYMEPADRACAFAEAFRIRKDN